MMKQSHYVASNHVHMFNWILAVLFPVSLYSWAFLTHNAIPGKLPGVHIIINYDSKLGYCRVHLSY